MIDAKHSAKHSAKHPNEDILEQLLNKAVSHVAGQCVGITFPHKFERCIKEYKEAVLKRMINDSVDDSYSTDALDALIEEIVRGY